MITGFLFRVIDLNEICIERCEASHLQCILNCPSNDVNCLSQCIREESECFNGKFIIEIISSIKVETPLQIVISACPCELNCLDGCTDCDNPVCECEVSYIDFNSLDTDSKLRTIPLGFPEPSILIKRNRDVLVEITYD